jgi:outer membrane protein
MYHANRLVLFLVVVLVGLGGVSAQAQTAQKFGHLNSGNLLTLLPEVQRADSVLAIFQNGMLAKGDTMAKGFETRVKQFRADYDAGKLPPIEAQKRQEELQKEQQTLQGFAQEIEQKVAILKKQLLEPVLSKVNDAIRAVGKENGYSAIFDEGTGVMLFTVPSDDVTPLVKAKLGLK